MISEDMSVLIQEALFSGDSIRLKETIQKLLLRSASYFDTENENFYHGFMLGLCALMSGFYVTSNRESGMGRYDLQLKPIKKGYPGILIELKAEKNCDEKRLKHLSKDALLQIDGKEYDKELKEQGVTTIYRYGVAFSGKKVEISVK